MMVPKQLDWHNHMFKVREEYASSEEKVHCALYKTVCIEQCKSCVWMKDMGEVDSQMKVSCQPPVIWEE